jgi:hypothetical protein
MGFARVTGTGVTGAGVTGAGVTGQELQNFERHSFQSASSGCEISSILSQSTSKTHRNNFEKNTVGHGFLFFARYQETKISRKPKAKNHIKHQTSKDDETKISATNTFKFQVDKSS